MPKIQLLKKGFAEESYCLWKPAQYINSSWREITQCQNYQYIEPEIEVGFSFGSHYCKFFEVPLERSMRIKEPGIYIERPDFCKNSER